MYIPLKPLFSRHNGIGVQFTDEPTGNLDSKNSQDVIDMLISASRRFKQTILMITHNNNLTSSVDRVFRVSDIIKESVKLPPLCIFSGGRI